MNQYLQTHKRLVIIATGLLVLVLSLLTWRLLDHGTSPKPTGQAATPPPAIAVIEITPSGFIPSTLAVNPNTEVIWVNEDVMPHLPAADPYPTHKDLPSLVAPRALGQKETYSFRFSKHETIPYHDDLNPILVGTVEVR